MSHIGHERFMESWYEYHYDEMITDYVDKKSPEISEEFESKLDPATPGDKRYELFIAWFKSKPEYVNAYEVWFLNQTPDGPEPEY